MRLRTIIQVILPACAGAFIGYANWEVYWNINIIPGSAWPAIVSSSLAQAVHGVSPALDIPFVVVVKALPLSVLFGLMVGLLLPRLKFQRVYCYSVFLWPIAYFTFGYFTISSLDPVAWPGAQVLWRAWYDHRVIAFAVYGWFFLGLYAGFVIAKRRVTLRSSGTAQ
jgi:hypothetical protein